MTKGKTGASADDLAVLEQGTPYVRSILAFLIYLRFANSAPQEVNEQTGAQVNLCFSLADLFIARLKKDMGA